MTQPDIRPLEPWGATARGWFWPLLFISGPILAILDGVGLIDRTEGFWLVAKIVLSVACAIAGVLWAVAAYRRRRATTQFSE